MRSSEWISDVCSSDLVDVWRMNAAEFGLPQRRQRVVLVGVPHGRALPKRPEAWTSVIEGQSSDKIATTTVAEPLGDLPPITAGQEGSKTGYSSEGRREGEKAVGTDQ